MSKLSFAIPCYRSENTIREVVSQIDSLMAQHHEYDYEIVMVNDCSPDGVWPVIKQLVKENKHCKGVCFAKNFGQHAALMAAYRECTGDFIATIDDDGQTPVHQVFIMMDALLEGNYDVVYAKYIERKDNGFRKFGTKVNQWMMEHLLGKPHAVQMTSFYVAKKFVIDEMCEYTHSFPYTWGLVLRVTRNIGNAMIEHEERKDGSSGYTISKLLNLWMNGFTAFSIKPLRISAIVGVIFAFLGVIGIIFTVVTKILVPETAAGYSSLMSVLLIIGGALMLSMGLIGEYIGRIYMCINVTPQYVVRERANQDGDNQ